MAGTLGMTNAQVAAYQNVIYGGGTEAQAQAAASAVATPTYTPTATGAGTLMYTAPIGPLPAGGSLPSSPLYQPASSLPSAPALSPLPKISVPVVVGGVDYSSMSGSQLDKLRPPNISTRLWENWSPTQQRAILSGKIQITPEGSIYIPGMDKTIITSTPIKGDTFLQWLAKGGWKQRLASFGMGATAGLAAMTAPTWVPAVPTIVAGGAKGGIGTVVGSGIVATTVGVFQKPPAIKTGEYEAALGYAGAGGGLSKWADIKNGEFAPSELKAFKAAEAKALALGSKLESTWGQYKEGIPKDRYQQYLSEYKTWEAADKEKAGLYDVYSKASSRSFAQYQSDYEKVSSVIPSKYKDPAGNINVGLMNKELGEAKTSALLAGIGSKPVVPMEVYGKLSPEAQSLYTAGRLSPEYQKGIFGAWGRGTKTVLQPIQKGIESKWWLGGKLGGGLFQYMVPHTMASELYKTKGPVAFTTLIPHFGPTAAYTGITWKEQSNLGRAAGIGFAVMPWAIGPVGAGVSKVFTPVGKVLGKIPIVGPVSKGVGWGAKQVGETVRVPMEMSGLRQYGPWRLAEGISGVAGKVTGLSTYPVMGGGLKAGIGRAGSKWGWWNVKYAPTFTTMYQGKPGFLKPTEYGAYDVVPMGAARDLPGTPQVFRATPGTEAGPGWWPGKYTGRSTPGGVYEPGTYGAQLEAGKLFAKGKGLGVETQAPAGGYWKQVQESMGKLKVVAPRVGAVAPVVGLSLFPMAAPMVGQQAVGVEGKQLAQQLQSQSQHLQDLQQQLTDIKQQQQVDLNQFLRQEITQQQYQQQQQDLQTQQAQVKQQVQDWQGQVQDTQQQIQQIQIEQSQQERPDVIQQQRQDEEQQQQVQQQDIVQTQDIRGKAPIIPPIFPLPLPVFASVGLGGGGGGAVPSWPGPLGMWKFKGMKIYGPHPLKRKVAGGTFMGGRTRYGRVVPRLAYKSVRI